MSLLLLLQLQEVLRSLNEYCSCSPFFLDQELNIKSLEKLIEDLKEKANDLLQSS